MLHQRKDTPHASAGRPGKLRPMLFAVVRERGPAWDASTPMREQDGWPAHADFMDGLVDEGFIVLGGPLGAGERRFLLVFDADGEESIRARLDEDPWTSAGTLRIASVEPWEILLGKVRTNWVPKRLDRRRDARHAGVEWRADSLQQRHVVERLLQEERSVRQRPAACWLRLRKSTRSELRKRHRGATVP